MDRSQAMTTFVAVVNKGGFARAARGTLTLTAPVLFGQIYVTPLLATYLERNPEVDAQRPFLDRVVNVVEEGIDGAVRIGELPDSSHGCSATKWPSSCTTAG